jgi:membrane peptidoglycan carboxypeptidase
MTYSEPEDRDQAPGPQDGAEGAQEPRPEDQPPDGYWPGMPDYPAKLQPSRAATGGPAASSNRAQGDDAARKDADADLPIRPGAAKTYLRSELLRDGGAGPAEPDQHNQPAAPTSSQTGHAPGPAAGYRPPAPNTAAASRPNQTTMDAGSATAEPTNFQAGYGPARQNPDDLVVPAARREAPAATDALSAPGPGTAQMSTDYNSGRAPAQAAPEASRPARAATSYQAAPPPAARQAGLPGRPGASAYRAGSAGSNRLPAKPRRRLGCGGVFGMGLFALALALLVFGGLLFGYVGIASALPSPEDLQARASQFASTQIFDRQGQLLNEIADPDHGRRTVVTIDQISKHLIDATVATEDPNFYQHPGVDPMGLARAVYYAVKDRDISGPGGSTITQQLVKLVYLSSERTPTRKIKEAVLAAEITRRYDKNTVLQIYLNEIYYGNLAYGIEAASETYFGKHAKDLDLAEASMLAGLPQAPAYYDLYTKLWEPDGQPGLVKKRQGTVLGLMVKDGKITATEADAAWQEALKLKPLQQSYTMKAPHFVYFVRGDVEKVLGPALLAKGGLKIYTTLDPKLQAIAEQEVAAQVQKLNAQRATDGALVAVRPATGEVLAMVGSADYNNDKIGGQINMAMAPRQPGSSIKPLTYLTAFSLPPAKIDDKTEPSDTISALEPAGAWTPATAILDIQTDFPDGNGRPPYVPKNYDGKEHGIVSVRTALANSYNIPAVKALQHIGLDKLKDTATKMGITTLTRPDYGLSLTLGGGEVTLLEMTGAYATLANGGSRAPLNEIACVIDANNQPIWRGNAADQVQGCQAARGNAPLLVNPEPAKPAVDPQSTYLITSILSDLEARRPAFGTAAELLSLPDRPAAAKTGTTNDNRDGWTLGYTPDLAVGVWVGNADYTAMQDVAGSVGAAPIWHNVMQRALQGVPPKQFPVPQGIQPSTVCADTGTLPSEACPAQREEVFASDRGPLPARFDLHQRLRVDKVTGQLGTEFTPADRVETKDFLIFPPRYRDWAKNHGFVQPDVDLRKYAFPPELTLSDPAQNSQVSGIVPVTGRVHLPDPLVWRLEYGVGPNPIGWGVLKEAQKGDMDGNVTNWDTGQTAAKHDERDFSLRLAAYDPANAAYPVAVSNVIYVLVESPTPTATATASPSPMPTATSSPSPTPAATATAPVTPTNMPVPTALPTETPAASPTTVPVASATATASPAPATPMPATPTPAPIIPAEGAVVASISQPANGENVAAGPIPIVGIAAGPGFVSYQLDIAPAAGQQPETWIPLTGPQDKPSPAAGGVLGTWPVQEFAPGAYFLRLAVLDKSGQAHMAIVQVTLGTGG